MKFLIKSFTLIEVLIIVGILTLLAALSVPAFRFSQQESDLNNSVEEIINILRLAQNKTLSSEGASQWGVYFENTTIPHQYILFKGSNYALRDGSFDEIHKIPKNVEIYEINLGEGKEAVFKQVTGEAIQIGNLKIRSIKNPEKTRTMCLAKYIIGFCQSTSLIVPITSTRHVHFNLGWSIRDATALKFDFVSAGQIETINMASYFDTDKTKFDWKGSFLVSGKEQEYHIHTHSLTTFNTILCIHRDGGNNQEVTIYIVDAGIDKEIVRYQTDGTGILGPYGGEFEIQ